jgi:8-oxo-dGTP pyrophosphatase MutT (NUDIX family)
MNYINKNIVCNNCGKHGHTQKQCNDPITSLGIICLKINEENANKCMEELVHKDIFDINQNIIIDIVKNLPSFNKTIVNTTLDNNIVNYKNPVEYLIIRRKHSLGYIEFIRGRYDINDTNTIFHLISQMTPTEIECLRTQNFKDIWEEVWKKTSYNKLYIKEMEESMEKFNLLKDTKFFEQELKNEYDEPEWGFPKGRRNPNEKNLKCALREFYEETGILKNNLIVLNKLFPLQEVFYGTNGVQYKHIYYIAIYNSPEDIGLHKIQEDQLTEIGDIKWKNLNECLKLFRPYHEEKKKILVSLHNYLTKIIDK